MENTIAIDNARLVYEGSLGSESAAISVVIPSHCVGISLGHCLRAFLEQTLARDYFEIVLVLDGVPVDESLIAVAARLPIRIYSVAESRGRGHARNVGLRHSRGGLVVSLDGDMVASPSLLSSYLEQHKQGSFACVGLRKFAVPAEATVGGQVFTDFVARCMARPDYRDIFYYQTEFLKKAAEPFWAFSTCNCSYPRALANHIGGFDENMRGWGLEDQEFGYRLWQTGDVQFVYLERALAIHVEHPRNLEEQENSWLGNLSYLKRKHGEIFRDPRRSVRLPALMPQDLVENSHVDKAWRTAPSVRFSLGLESNAAWSADTGRLFPVSGLDMQMLGFSTIFRSIEEHAQNAIRRAPALFGDDPEAAMACLLRLREAGGLISRGEILTTCRHHAQQTQEVPPLEWLTIPTRGDSVSVVRALHSYIDNAHFFKHSPRFFIADDSASSEDRAGMRIALSRITKDRPVRIVYAGEEEKRAFSLELIDKGIPASVVHQAIFGFGDGSICTGANRNAILLATAGSLILTVDDDTICNTGKARSGTANETLAIEGEGEFQEFWHFTDRQAALDSVEFEMIDFVGSHAQLLGLSLPSIVVSATDSEDPPDCDRMCPHMLNWLMRGTGQIVLTSNGAVGDSGMHSRIPFLANRNAISLMRFERSEGDYARVSQAREIVRQSRTRVVGHTLFFQTMFAGLDNRIPLPPFFPGYRNQDGVFAKTLSVCVEAACIGHIPMVLEHSPNVTPINADGAVGRIRVCNLVIACMALWRPRSDEEKVEDRIRSLGRHLEFLGSSPPKDFKASVYPPLLAETSAFVTNAQELLRSTKGQPEYWARDLTRQLDTISARVFDLEFLQPLDLPATISPADGLAHVQRLVRDFGRLLQWWPAMFEGSRELARAGKGLGQELNYS